MQKITDQNQADGREGTKSFTSFLSMLEDGNLHSDLSEALRSVNADMNNHAAENGGKSKAKMTIELEFLLDKGVFEIRSNFKVKSQEKKRERTIAWSTPGNNFTPHNPRQMNLFEKPRETAYERGEVREVNYSA